MFLWNELDGIVPAVAMPVRVYEAELADAGDDEWDGQIKKIKNNTQAIAQDTKKHIELALDARMSRLEESLTRRVNESVARRVDESVSRHVGALREALLADRQPPPAPAQ